MRDLTVNPIGSESVYSLKVNRAILKHLETHKELEIDLNSLSLTIAGETFELRESAQESHVDCYNLNGTILEKIGSVVSRLHVVPKLDSKTGGVYKELTLQEQQKRENRRSILLDDTKSKVRGKINRKPVSSPAAHAKSNSVPERTLLDARKKKVPAIFKPNLGVRKKLVHMLALRPLGIKSLSDMLGKDEAEIRTELRLIATPQLSDPSIYQLKSASFKELNVWNHPYTDKEREMVIKNAQIAFDQLNLPKNSHERLMLNKDYAKTQATVSPAPELYSSPDMSPAVDRKALSASPQQPSLVEFVRKEPSVLESVGKEPPVLDSVEKEPSLLESDRSINSLEQAASGSEASEVKPTGASTVMDVSPKQNEQKTKFRNFPADIPEEQWPKSRTADLTRFLEFGIGKKKELLEQILSIKKISKQINEIYEANGSLQEVERLLVGDLKGMDPDAFVEHLSRLITDYQNVSNKVELLQDYVTSSK